MRQFTLTEILMAKKAKEIQDRLPLFSERLSSFFWYRDEGHEEGAVTLRGWMDISTSTYEYAWLPLEHQLWEMLPAPSSIYTLHIFYEWAKWCYLPDDGTSLWQLLLAFVMQEFYGKVWNGEDWITA